MGKRLVDGFDVVLLDLMDTLMFDGNRFSADQNYATTYQRLGGQFYSAPVVQRIINAVYDRMHHDYSCPDRYTNFPVATVYIAQVLTDYSLPADDADRLGKVFAHHELGHIPDGHVQALHTLSRTHRLGLVSNLWAEASLFRQTFQQAGIHDLFEVLVFSSDHACIKPSPRLFQLALDGLCVEPGRVLFVGDDVHRDVAAAEAIGMKAVLIDKKGQQAESDWRVRSVAELVE